MVKYNNVSLNKIYLCEDSEFLLTYTGELANSNKLFIHYGTNNWGNVNNLMMTKTPEGFKAKINIPAGTKSFNFCFKDNNNNWDNNNSENFKFDVLPMSMTEKKSKFTEKTDFFSNDFLLAYSLNKEINFDNTKEELEKYDSLKDIEEDKIDISTNSSGLSDLELENISFAENNEAVKYINEQLTKKFNMFFGIENSKETILIEKAKPAYTSKIHYVKLFKEARREALLEVMHEELKDKKFARFTTSYPIMNIMRMEANKKWINKVGTEEEKSQFALVNTYSNIDLYDNSLFGTIRQYVHSIVDSFKKLIGFVVEDFARDNN